MGELIRHVSRPVMPDGYGIPEKLRGVLTWSFVEEQMSLALNYWVSTTRPDGRPHAMPVWGVWWEGCFYFEGSPLTRRGRNLAHHPATVVHLESGDRVVILEGDSIQVEKPDRDLTIILSQVFSKKYSDAGYQPGPEQWDNGGLYVMKPDKVFAWTKFPDDTTRWVMSPR